MGTNVRLIDPATGQPYRAGGAAGADGGSATTASNAISRGSGSIAAGQVAVTTSATQVVPARSGRSAVTISSATAVAYWVGGASVSAANGYSVPATAGAGVTLPTSAAVFAIGASAVTLTYIETF